MRQDYGLESDYCAPAPTVIAKIPMGGRTGDVVISPDNSRAYVARSNSIAVISRLNNILGIIPISGDPKGLTINAAGSRLYVTNHEGSVSVVDVADHWMRVLPGASCAQEVVTADRALIYTAHNAKYDGRCTSWISVNDTEGATVATIPGVGGYEITDLAVDPNGTRVYAGLSGYSSYYQYCTGLVSMIDTARYAVIDDIDIAVSPDTITVSPDGSTMYATHYDTEFVSAVDLASRCLTTIALRDAPLALTLTPDGLQAYVTSCCSLSVIDTVTNEAACITVGDLPRSVQISPDGKRAYVSNFGDHSVSVIDTVTQCVVNTIDVGGHPEGLAVSPDGGRLYVSDYWSGTVTVVSM